MSAGLAHIPPSLFDRLESLRSTLEKNGTVMLRQDKGRKPCYRVRARVFDEELGYIKQRAIVLDDEVVAGAVRKLISMWRAEYQRRLLAEKKALEEQRRVKRLQELEDQELRQMLREMIPGSIHRKRRVMTEFNRMLKLGVIPSTLWVLGKEYLRGWRGLPGKKREALPTSWCGYRWRRTSSPDLASAVVARPYPPSKSSSSCSLVMPPARFCKSLPL